MNPVFMGYILKPEENGRRFTDSIFKLFFCSILIEMALKFIQKRPNYNISALIPIIAWHPKH